MHPTCHTVAFSLAATCNHMQSLRNKQQERE
jgi:hypothetical protein